jgi:hypothetical protein
MEKGIVVSSVVPNRTPSSQQMFRAAAPPQGFRALNFGQRNATKRRADDPRGVLLLVPGAMQRIALAKRCFAEP